MANPFLDINTYIADGEPHVFGDRVYLFGSHDIAGGNTYCMLDYTFPSAPLDDLENWTSRGISYRAEQDPQYGDILKYMYAPDVVQGNDGRFYLYYCMSGEKGVGGYGQKISVAVCDTPDGQYEYYGFVRNPDKTPMLKYVTFDPAVINDEGTIRLYYGAWYPFDESVPLLGPVFYRIESNMFGKNIDEIKAYQDGIMGANHVILGDDMLTIKSEPCHIMPNKVKGTDFEKHPFFEASSIRKIGSQYYFIYSSMKGHELCYATSSYPDRDFRYGGVIISNGDIGFNGRNDSARLNTTGTNHGSIECINGQWYVFYHRNTHKSAYSRQACVERIALDTSGNIKQTEITSLGFSKSLKTDKTYPASICCNLYSGRMPHIGNGISSKNIPYIAESSNKQIVIATNKTKMVYKYFEVEAGHYILSIKCKADSNGKIIICTGQESFEADISAFEEWNNIKIPIVLQGGTLTLSIEYKGPKILFVESLRICRNSKM